MCMEDVRIGRKSMGALQTVAVTAAYGGFISPDEDRTCLSIYPVATNTIFVSISPSQPASTGIRINDATGPLIMDLRTHGDLVRKQWFAMTSGAGPDSVTYTSASLAEE